MFFFAKVYSIETKICFFFKQSFQLQAPGNPVINYQSLVSLHGMKTCLSLPLLLAFVQVQNCLVRLNNKTSFMNLAYTKISIIDGWRSYLVHLHNKTFMNISWCSKVSLVGGWRNLFRQSFIQCRFMLQDTEKNLEHSVSGRDITQKPAISLQRQKCPDLPMTSSLYRLGSSKRDKFHGEIFPPCRTKNKFWFLSNKLLQKKTFWFLLAFVKTLVIKIYWFLLNSHLWKKSNY